MELMIGVKTNFQLKAQIFRMDSTSSKIALLLLVMLVGQADGQSPCPNFFRYIRDDHTNQIAGYVEIPNPPTGTALHLKVGLSIAAALPSKYVGRLELAQSREDSVRDVYAGKSIKYRIYFPVRQPLPLLTGLWFNQQSYCTGPRATEQIVTSIVLEHTLFPPGVLPLSESQGSPNPSKPIFVQPTIAPSYPIFTHSRPQVTLRPPQPTKLPNSVNIFLTPIGNNNGNNYDVDGDENNSNRVLINNHDECGRSSATASNINLLIARGVKTSPGQWPWVAAIFLVKIEFEFQCAGTLITHRHVITAAHCFKLENGINVPASALLVSLGRYRLRDWHERGSVNREVQDYKFHPAYRHQASADSDLAVVVLRERIDYSPLIKPICMWSESNNLASIVGKSGFVVGWGRDELGNPYLAEPRMVKVPIVSQEECLRTNANFVAFTSNRTFCAGLRDGTGPCNGDSGSGLVIRDRATGRYQLRGIVSRSLRDEATTFCDLAQFVVYVDVAKHLGWIQEQLLNDSV